MKKYYFIAVPEDKPNQIVIGGVTKDEALAAIPVIQRKLPGVKIVTWTFISGEEEIDTTTS